MKHVLSYARPLYRYLFRPTIAHLSFLSQEAQAFNALAISYCESGLQEQVLAQCDCPLFPCPSASAPSLL